MSILSCRVGVQRLEDVEDAVQSTLMVALQTWPTSGVPDNPSAWLYRVARNEVLGELRKRSSRRSLLESHFEDETVLLEALPEVFFEDEMSDDLLRMLFACCDGNIPKESQLVLALKTLCGFDVREIALRLFTSEANIYKRLARARTHLQKLPVQFGELTGEQYASRLPAVHTILYLLFTEGYLSTHAELAIRQELCEEAVRLTNILADHPIGGRPETFALLALMHLHAARITARQDGSGGLLLLEEQDRNLWDRERIRIGIQWLSKSAKGDVFSRYHAEAGIAAEHGLAPTFQETRWDRIVENYALLEHSAPSVLHRLNRAIAVAEWRGPEAGLRILADSEPPTWLGGSYQWAAVLADLHRRADHQEKARRYHRVACEASPSKAIRELLRRRFEAH